MFIDGDMKYEENASQLIGNGAVILGHDQGAYMGNFDEQKYLQGNNTTVSKCGTRFFLLHKYQVLPKRATLGMRKGTSSSGPISSTKEKEM